MKSLYSRLSEAIDKMSKKQRDAFYESKPKDASVEVQLNCAEAVLCGKKVKESEPVRKHNGPGQFVELNEAARGEYSNLTESERTARLTSDQIMNERIAQRDPVFAEALRSREAEQKELDGLTRLQEGMYRLHRKCGIPHLAALANCKEPFRFAAA